MAVAAAVLASVDPSLEPPVSVRSAGVAPWSLRVAPSELMPRLANVVAAEANAVGDGKLAVIVPPQLVDAVVRAVPGAAVATLEQPVVVLSVEQAKGLEFDGVVIVEPASILAASDRGSRDLYVALTRTTRRLGVVHTGDLPAVLHQLRALGG